ncbi:hypothetical protein H5410_056816 [Solanum commersonii]|uniref:Uncharacterized protein n=1 Tax=Solanum commersonii TaxID=4109 RepID=A0A9J5WMD2_SOLCO|nr:hypothetical protein H5410_056816 [Solanum commersonii]
MQFRKYQFFIAKRISYIISWSFDILKFEKIKYLRKTVKIKGWVPAVRNDKLISSSSPWRDFNNYKEKLKITLEEALLISHDESRNKDMLDLQGIAQAYLLN